jgi:hypothetical protein
LSIAASLRWLNLKRLNGVYPGNTEGVTSGWESLDFRGLRGEGRFKVSSRSFGWQSYRVTTLGIRQEITSGTLGVQRTPGT